MGVRMGVRPKAPAPSPSTLQVVYGPETHRDSSLSLLGLLINSNTHIFICTICNSAVPPEQVYSHVRQFRHNPKRDFRNGCRLAFATKSYFDSLVQSFGIVDPALNQPGTIIPTIPGLPLFDNLCCCHSCGYAVRAEKTILQHLHNVCTDSTWYLGPAQTFRRSSNRRYFAVEVRKDVEQDLNPLDPVTLFQQQFSVDPFENAPIQGTLHPREMLLFLNYDNWLKEVEGLTPKDIFHISWDAMPKLRKDVRRVVCSYVGQVIVNLSSDQDPAMMLALGDYNK
jgi:hypothetical protein